MIKKNEMKLKYYKMLISVIDPCIIQVIHKDVHIVIANLTSC